jgi:S-adenosylmethionine:diacylglycerol 3-amino-3-carboxypropyl transferase
VRAPVLAVGFSREDERVTAAALAVSANKRILCAAGGGEVALGLASRGAVVDAVDLRPAQAHLVALKLAAVQVLEPADAARFLGYATDPGSRRWPWYASVRGRLSAEAQTYWDWQRARLIAGVVWSGRIERSLLAALWLIRPSWGRAALEALCTSTSREEQQAVFDRRIDRWWLRWAVRWLVLPYVRWRGEAPAVAVPFPRENRMEQVLRWFRVFCTATPATDNWFLQMVLLGHLLDPERGPDFLRPEGVTALRGGATLTVHNADLESWLAADLSRYDGLDLSSAGEQLDPLHWEALLRAVVARAAPDARVVWREGYHLLAIPDAVSVVIDRENGETLGYEDRFPFYRVVPGRVIGQSFVDVG